METRNETGSRKGRWERSYSPVAIERRWQDVWRERSCHAAPGPSHPGDPAYVFSPAPFTSGDIHMGHVRSYTIADVYARFRRARGDAVLFCLGFDSFGLPAEQAAAKRAVAPAAWISRCRARMSKQLDRLGLSLDWTRSFVTSEEEQYRWSQWLFLEFMRAGLVYRASEGVARCPQCETVLARVQVQDGRCWRCNAETEITQLRQWFLRVTAYLDENEQRLEQLSGWDGMSVAAQRTVIGRVEGAELSVLSPDGAEMTVFVSAPERLAEARFAMLSPRHPQVGSWAADPVVKAELEKVRKGGLAREDRKAKEVPIVDTGYAIQVPGVSRLLPVVITPGVDARFGPTFVLGIPGDHDADRTLADRIPSDVRREVVPPVADAVLETACRYRARDFVISRQRAWGTPIPIVHCGACGAVPVPVSELPVRLPSDLDVEAGGNALAARADFAATACPKCGAAARRETDTLDCHLDGIWAQFPGCVPREERRRSMFTHPELNRWLPAAMVVWGADGGPYMFDERMITKALRDIGPLSHFESGEPFVRAVMHEMVHLDGQKMSKHLGNVVDPMSLVEDLGADTVRFAILHAAAPRKVVRWSEDLLLFATHFLREVWEYAEGRMHWASGAHIDRADPIRRRLAGRCEAAIRRLTASLEGLDVQRATRGLIHLLARIREFERTATATRRVLNEEDREAVGSALVAFVRMLAPISPHLAEELWDRAGRGGLICEAAWPDREQL